MLPTNRGEVLVEEFLKPLRVTQVGLAAHLGVPVQRVNGIARGKRGITAETAWMLSQSLGNKPHFWVNLQTAHDLGRQRPHKKVARMRRSA